jgi:pyruvate ferredoxin oxidoreductase delta subunit
MQKLVEERLKKLPSMKKLEGPYSVKIADVKTGTWRKHRPVIDDIKCIKCSICSEYCPCGVIERGDRVTIDYTYCKGCGICVEECPKKAISFVDETDFKKEADE